MLSWIDFDPLGEVNRRGLALIAIIEVELSAARSYCTEMWAASHSNQTCARGSTSTGCKGPSFDDRQ
jgi:hypothetical protein